MHVSPCFRKHPKLTLWIVVAVGSLGSLAILEVVLALFLRFPGLNNYFPYFKSTVTAVYFSNDRDILHLIPAYAQYDSQLTYILRPGEFDFGNREYYNHYFVNSSGVRDDEASLHQPEIIVLGDSYALGWGVEQDETFPQLLEKQTGKKVLNAAVSSYGTVRELMLLGRMDTSHLKTLVIQYSDNDFEENHEYVRHGYYLNIRSRESYMAECKGYNNRIRYKPFLFVSAFLRINVRERFFRENTVRGNLKTASAMLDIWSKFQSANDLQTTTGGSRNSARIFLDILSRQQFGSINIMVLNLSHYTLDSHSFIKSVAELKNSGKYPEVIKKIKVIDASAFLKEEDYYIIDDHLKKSGHEKVAQAIAAAIKLEE